ncbi:EXLDI protein [Nocardia sp. XZ_19_385]|uniref:EXLDI protein n=1 Tax=Nocardia sp. XZ_19_385 TaxID=2769488 RepID=UPI00188E4B40|nr:EXLDI protein [Nocardia sp. XZ_19_385]
MSTDPQPVDVTKAPEDLEQITLKVGPGGHRAQRFFGKQIAEAYEASRAGVAVTRVYRSRKGKYVVHKRQSNWVELADVRNWETDWKAWVSQSINPLGNEPETGDYTVEILDTLEQLREHVPARTYREVADVVQHPSTQDLDV